MMFLKLDGVLEDGGADVGLGVELAEGIGEGGGRFGFAVDDEDAFHGAGEFTGPVAQFGAVGVAAEGVDGFDVAADAERFAEDGDLFVAAGKVGAECVGGAPADDEDGGAGVLDVVFDVVPDTTGFGHAGGAKDDAGFAEGVDADALLDGADVGEVGGSEWVAAVLHDGPE